MSARTEVIFQVPNQVGLGHMNRMACVALALRDLDPHLKILFVVEGQSHGFLESFDLPYLSLPYPDELYRSLAWSRWPESDKGQMLQGIVLAIIEATQPRVVVYDCFPSRHFVAALQGKSIQNILCIRKVKDFKSYEEDPRLRTLLAADDTRIIVPHTREDFSLADRLDRRATYVGEIVKPLPLDPMPIQLKFDLAAKKVILICAGGGGHRDTTTFYNLCLAAFSSIKGRRTDLTAVLITGPLFNDWSHLELVSDVFVMPFDPDFVASCATADLVVSQAGYNSVNELAALASPTILIPAERGFDNQFERASLAEMRYPNMHYFRGTSSHELEKMMEQCLNARFNRVRLDASDGAYLAAHLILKSLDKV